VRPLTALSTSVITVRAFWKAERCESCQAARCTALTAHPSTPAACVLVCIVRRR
jgi:hypothetical protein